MQRVASRWVSVGGGRANAATLQDLAKRSGFAVGQLVGFD